MYISRIKGNTVIAGFEDVHLLQDLGRDSSIVGLEGKSFNDRIL